MDFKHIFPHQHLEPMVITVFGHIKITRYCYCKYGCVKELEHMLYFCWYDLYGFIFNSSVKYEPISLIYSKSCRTTIKIRSAFFLACLNFFFRKWHCVCVNPCVYSVYACVSSMCWHMWWRQHVWGQHVWYQRSSSGQIGSLSFWF